MGWIWLSNRSVTAEKWCWILGVGKSETSRKAAPLGCMREEIRVIHRMELGSEEFRYFLDFGLFSSWLRFEIFLRDFKLLWEYFGLERSLEWILEVVSGLAWPMGVNLPLSWLGGQSLGGSVLAVDKQFTRVRYASGHTHKHTSLLIKHKKTRKNQKTKKIKKKKK